MIPLAAVWGQAPPGTDAELAALLAGTRDPRVRVQEEAIAGLVRMGTRALPALVENLATDSNLFSRAASARALGETGDAVVLPALIAACTDSALEVRAALAAALARFPHPAVVAPLVGLAADPSASVRLAALAALADRPGAPVDEAFRRALADRDLRVVLAAAEAAAARRDPGALPELFALIRSPFTTFLAADALTACVRPAHADFLLSLLPDGDRFTRGFALLLLGEIGAEKAREPLLAFLDHEDAALRLCAACGLLAMRRLADTTAALGALERSLVGDATPQQLAALGLLEGLREPEALSLIARGLASGEPHVRMRALLALAQWPPSQAAPQLLAALQDPCDDVVELARGLLGDMTGADHGRDAAAWRRLLESE